MAESIMMRYETFIISVRDSSHRAEVRRSFITTTIRDESQVTPQGHHRQGSNKRPTASSSMPLPTWTRHDIRHPYIDIASCKLQNHILCECPLTSRPRAGSCDASFPLSDQSRFTKSMWENLDFLKVKKHRSAPTLVVNDFASFLRY